MEKMVRELFQIQEIGQQEFCDHIGDEDFFQAYENPLIINCYGGRKLLAIA